MPDFWVWGLTATHWLALAFAACVAAAAGWLAVMLLLHPEQETGIPGLMPVQGFLASGSALVATFAVEHLLVDLPPPRRFFEQLGPDRFRREFGRALKERLDEHVDDVMTRRNGPSWETLSGYARNRIYIHVHRRLPYVVDDFVDQVQGNLDDIVHPAILVRRWFVANPEKIGAAFIDCFGPELRSTLVLAALAGALVTAPVPWLVGGIWQWVVVGGVAALAGCLVVLARLSLPVSSRGIWPLQSQGIIHRHRQRFVRMLADRVVRDALGWRAITAEFLRGAHAGRVRHMMRREVASILDVAVFRASMQFLLGPEGFAEVKSSAVEKAVEMLATAPVSATLREHYRVELERTIGHAALRVTPEAYADLWDAILLRAWKNLPVFAVVAGALAGWATGWLVLHFVARMS